MMNFVSLALLLSSLTAAGVWSPHLEAEPNHHPTSDDNNHILREGHNLIVVEYERQVDPPGIPGCPVDDTNHKNHEPAAPVLSRAYQAEPQGSANSLVCDGYGVCKEVVSGLIGKGKEKTSEKVAEIEVAAKETLKKAYAKASELKESIERTDLDAAEKTEQLKDAVIEKASTSKECAKKVAKGTIDKAKEAAQELSRNVSDLAHKAGHKAEKTVEVVSGNLTDILRRAKEVAFDAAAYFWAFETGKTAAATLHLLGFATAYGTCIWVTFVSSNVLAASLMRLQFGMVQSKLYPVYFRVVAYGIALAFVAHFLGRDRTILAERAQGYNLLSALAMVMANMFLLEPRATKVMFERMKVEKEEGRGIDMADATTAEPGPATSKKPSTSRAPATTMKVAGDEQQGAKSELVQLNGKLRRLNTFSSFLNILALMSLSWHLVHLARQMQHKC